MNTIASIPHKTQTYEYLHHTLSSQLTCDAPPEKAENIDAFATALFLIMGANIEDQKTVDGIFYRTYPAAPRTVGCWGPFTVRSFSSDPQTPYRKRMQTVFENLSWAHLMLTKVSDKKAFLEHVNKRKSSESAWSGETSVDYGQHLYDVSMFRLNTLQACILYNPLEEHMQSLYSKEESILKWIGDPTKIEEEDYSQKLASIMLVLNKVPVYSSAGKVVSLLDFMSYYHLKKPCEIKSAEEQIYSKHIETIICGERYNHLLQPSNSTIDNLNEPLQDLDLSNLTLEDAVINTTLTCLCLNEEIHRSLKLYLEEQKSTFLCEGLRVSMLTLKHFFNIGYIDIVKHIQNQLFKSTREILHPAERKVLSAYAAFLNCMMLYPCGENEKYLKSVFFENIESYEDTAYEESLAFEILSRLPNLQVKYYDSASRQMRFVSNPGILPTEFFSQQHLSPIPPFYLNRKYCEKNNLPVQLMSFIGHPCPENFQKSLDQLEAFNLLPLTKQQFATLAKPISLQSVIFQPYRDNNIIRYEKFDRIIAYLYQELQGAAWKGNDKASTISSLSSLSQKKAGTTLEFDNKAFLNTAILLSSISSGKNLIEDYTWLEEIQSLLIGKPSPILECIFHSSNLQLSELEKTTEPNTEGLIETHHWVKLIEKFKENSRIKDPCKSMIFLAELSMVAKVFAPNISAGDLLNIITATENFVTPRFESKTHKKIFWSIKHLRENQFLNLLKLGQRLEEFSLFTPQSLIFILTHSPLPELEQLSKIDLDNLLPLFQNLKLPDDYALYLLAHLAVPTHIDNSNYSIAQELRDIIPVVAPETICSIISHPKNIKLTVWMDDVKAHICKIKAMLLDSKELSIIDFSAFGKKVSEKFNLNNDGELLILGTKEPTDQDFIVSHHMLSTLHIIAPNIDLEKLAATISVKDQEKPFTHHFLGTVLELNIIPTFNKAENIATLEITVLNKLTGDTNTTEWISITLISEKNNEQQILFLRQVIGLYGTDFALRDLKSSNEQAITNDPRLENMLVNLRSGFTEVEITHLKSISLEFTQKLRMALRIQILEHLEVKSD